MRSFDLVLGAVVLAGVWSFQSPGACVASDGVAWRTNVDAAKIEASQSKKLILLHFWTPKCGPCRILEHSVFNQANVGEGLERDYVPVKVNADLWPALATSLQIKSVPTDVVLTPQGNVVASLSCPDTPNAYLGQLANVARHHRRTAAAAHANSAPPSVNAAYAGLDTGKYAAIQAQATPVASTQPAPSPQLIQGTPAPQPAGPTPVTAQSPAIAAGPGVGAAAVGPPSSGALAQTNPYIQRPAAPTSASPSVAAAPPKIAAAQEPSSGTSLLGFEGFCPVSLKLEHKWVRGDKEVGIEHRGRTYLFASEQHRTLFVADPDGYCPVFDGMDPVVLLDERRTVEGSRRFGYKYEGVFYLFSGAESMQKFKANPDFYARGVHTAMRQLESGASQVLRR